MKFVKTFRGVPDGEIYPVEYSPGDDCPPELELAAQECGVLDDKPGKAKPEKAK